MPRQRNNPLNIMNNQDNRGIQEESKKSPENGIQRKAGIAILTSDKIDFKIKKGNKRQKWTFCNDKGHFIINNTSRRYNTH